MAPSESLVLFQWFATFGAIACLGAAFVARLPGVRHRDSDSTSPDPKRDAGTSAE